MNNWHLLSKEEPPNPKLFSRDDYLCTVFGEKKVVHLQYGSYNTIQYTYCRVDYENLWLKNGKPYNKKIIAWMPFPDIFKGETE